MTRVLVTGGAGFISSNLCRHLLRASDHEVVIMDALTYAGNTANIADLLGPRAPRVRRGRHPRCRARRGGRRGRRRDRQRRRRVARREVDPRRRERVRDHERRGHAGAARRLIRRHPGRALHPGLVERGLRHGRARPDGRGPPAQPALAVRRHEGRRRPPRLQLLVHLRHARRGRAAVQQLRPLPAPREGHPALHHRGAPGSPADGARRRHGEPRLAARRGHLGGDRGRSSRRRSSASRARC